jgi:broad-specificity NMP kinase
MNAIIINSAPGVGKTTLLRLLENKLSEGYAMIDGDDVARTVPLVNSTAWLDLMQDNIAACAKNYHAYCIRTLLVSFVFPTWERLRRLAGLLEREGFAVFHLRLLCRADELEKRMRIRNTQRMVSRERALELNRQIEELSSEYAVDTTGKTVEQVAETVCEKIQEMESKGKATDV